MSHSETRLSGQTLSGTEGISTALQPSQNRHRNSYAVYPCSETIRLDKLRQAQTGLARHQGTVNSLLGLGLQHPWLNKQLDRLKSSVEFHKDLLGWAIDNRFDVDTTETDEGFSMAEVDYFFECKHYEYIQDEVETHKTIARNALLARDHNDKCQRLDGLLAEKDAAIADKEATLHATNQLVMTLQERNIRLQGALEALSGRQQGTGTTRDRIEQGMDRGRTLTKPGEVVNQATPNILATENKELVHRNKMLQLRIKRLSSERNSLQDQMKSELDNIRSQTQKTKSETEQISQSATELHTLRQSIDTTLSTLLNTTERKSPGPNLVQLPNLSDIGKRFHSLAHKPTIANMNELHQSSKGSASLHEAKIPEFPTPPKSSRALTSPHEARLPNSFLNRTQKPSLPKPKTPSLGAAAETKTEPSRSSLHKSTHSHSLSSLLLPKPLNLKPTTTAAAVETSSRSRKFSGPVKSDVAGACFCDPGEKEGEGQGQGERIMSFEEEDGKREELRRGREGICGVGCRYG